MSIELRDERVIASPASAIWPVLSDTAGMNRRMGLAPMSFTTINGVRHGTQKVLGLTLKWTEKPWEWKFESWLKNERVYSQGFFKRITGLFEIHPHSEDRSRVVLRFGVEHRWPLLAALFNKATRSVMKQLLDELEKSLQRTHATGASPVRFADLAQWLSAAPGMERARMAPKLVAQDIGSEWPAVMRASLAGEFKGRLAVRFDAVCPHCRGSKKSAARLTELASPVRCDSCEIDFPLGTQESIEVSLKDLALPPEQAAMDFCSADVTHKPTIVYQRLGGKWLDSLKLAPGLYQLKKKGEPHALALMADEGAEHALLDLDHLWERAHYAPLRVHPELGLRGQNLTADCLVMLEQTDRFRGALTVAEVSLHPDLGNLIPPGSLASDFAIEMGHRSLMFTDVVGSTDLYHDIGDNEAFALVRESFVLIGEVAKRYEGSLVKTIGDATMYAFTNPEAALKCAVEIQAMNRGRRLKLRASLHHGPCLSVGTGDGVDFFGDTVNVCAKFQSEAEAGQVVFSADMQHQVAPEVWRAWAPELESLEFKLKNGRAFQLYRLSLGV